MHFQSGQSCVVPGWLLFLVVESKRETKMKVGQKEYVLRLHQGGGILFSTKSQFDAQSWAYWIHQSQASFRANASY